MFDNFFVNEKLTDRITRIDCEGEVSCFLIDGKDRAALIDTGTGYKSLRGYVESLTDKEITVFLTHSHLDHAGGIGEFDTVYVHEKDVPGLERGLDPEARRDYVSSTVPDAKVSDMICGMPRKQLLTFRDGDCFDLGGTVIKMCDLPGHTVGSTAVLIVEDRTVILGDALNSLAFMFDASRENLETYKNAVKSFMDVHEEEYDTCLYSHPHNKGTKEIVPQMYALMERVLDGSVTPASSDRLRSKDGKACLPIGENMLPEDGTFANVVLFGLD